MISKAFFIAKMTEATLRSSIKDSSNPRHVPIGQAATGWETPQSASTAGLALRSLTATSAQGQDAYQPLVPVDDEKAPDLVFGHDLSRMVDGIVLVGPTNSIRHDLAHLRLPVVAFSDAANGNVSV